MTYKLEYLDSIKGWMKEFETDKLDIAMQALADHACDYPDITIRLVDTKLIATYYAEEGQ